MTSVHSYPLLVDKLLTYGDCRNINPMPNYVEEFQPNDTPLLI